MDFFVDHLIHVLYMYSVSPAYIVKNICNSFKLIENEIIAIVSEEENRSGNKQSHSQTMDCIAGNDVNIGKIHHYQDL